MARTQLVMAWLPTILLAAVTGTAACAEESTYVRHIRPLLAAKCGSCHGALKQEAGLRLDAGRLIRLGGDSGTSVNISAPDESLLLERVRSDDPSYRMPPEDAGSPLSNEQIAMLHDWIQAGAPSPAEESIPESPEQHWAYQPIQRPPLPHGTRSRHPVDAFLEATLRSAGIRPVAMADPNTRLRRLYLDLVGMPPSIEEQRRFMESPSPLAWRQLVDELLEQPRYGERWGRHWMDIWRYSDWDGYKNQLRGSQRHIWRWRDWIIQSLNEDKGYDQMILEMLAGDEIAPDDIQTLRATGFLARNYHHSNRNMWLDATVEHTAKAFLAMTINCARCHDHKYDPIPQQEYYALRAVFEPHQVRTERLPGESDLVKHGLARVFDADLEASTYVYLGGNDKLPDKDNPVQAAPPSAVSIPYDLQAVSMTRLARHPALRPFVAREDMEAARAKVRKQEAELARTPNDDEHALAVARARLQVASANVDALEARWRSYRGRVEKQLDEASQTSLHEAAWQSERALAVAKAELVVEEKRRDAARVEASDAEATNRARSALAQAEEKLQQAVDFQPQEGEKRLPKPVGKDYPAVSTGRRLALARWITDPRNPLTARVCVNHIWLRHFGTPLVDNVFDFGLRSDAPAHLPLLDFLATELMRSNWSMKHLHRLLVTSDAYQRVSSGVTAEAQRGVDPDNRLYWRANVRRLEAEAVRDSMLWVSGELDATLGGPELDFARGETIPRRSLYFRHAYEKQMTMLTVFDGAGTTECYQRSESVIPQQALAMANSAMTITLSRRLGKTLSRQFPDDDAFIQAVFPRILGRPCSNLELEASRRFLHEQSNLLANPESLTPHGGTVEAAEAASSAPRARARENFIHVLFNHNDFVTVR